MAVVCCDDVDVKENELYEEFKRVHPSSCKIPGCINAGEESWKKGRYWYCKQIYDEGILGVFKAIIECLEKLNKDMDSANQMYTTMCEMAENEYLELGAMTFLSNALFKPHEQLSGHANVCALFFLPQAFFEMFSRDEYCFLPMMEYIVKGVGETERQRREIRSLRDEIESLRDEVESLRDEIESLKGENKLKEGYADKEVENDQNTVSAKFIIINVDNKCIILDNQIINSFEAEQLLAGLLEKWKEKPVKASARDTDANHANEVTSRDSGDNSINTYEKEDSSIKDSGGRDDR